MPRAFRHPLILTVAALAASPTLAAAQNPDSNPNKTLKALANPSKPPEPRALVLSPAPAPVPALKYRLLPLSSELNPGDAAPIYLRIRHETPDEAWRQIAEKPSAWLALPIDQLPTAEARKFVDMWGNRLHQIELGAHRQSCDWAYTLPEQREDAWTILLPDAQSMPSWGRLVGLKARVEIAEGKPAEAIRTIETGMAFGRHIADGPFLINELVGISICNVLLDRVEELIVRPDAPNLYWALTALPRPLVSLRHGLETESKMGEWVMPELTDLDRPRTEAEWTTRLEKLHARLVRLTPMMMAGNEKETAAMQGLLTPDAATLAHQSLDRAREYLRTRQGLSKEQADRMPAAQAVLSYLAGSYAERRDDLFKAGYLDYPEALAVYRPVVDCPDPTVRVLTSFLVVIKSPHQAAVRLDRRVAALRVVEALRLHAAAHEGKLPESLEKVGEVPVPIDPATGRPFEYRRDGEAALLSGPAVDLPPPGLSYRITIRPGGGTGK